MHDEVRFGVRGAADVVPARRAAREAAARLGFSESDQARIMTAVSEIASNIVTYAGSGEVTIRGAAPGGRRGLVIVASDRGPGIPDLELAMQDGYSTGMQLGLGLPSAKRLMDDFEIVSEVGRGTTVTMAKWLR